MARIVVNVKKKPRLETDAARITIGTRTSCDLTLRDPVAAEHHAEITQSGAAFLIADLGSATGTYVGGLAITGPTPLQDGAEIVIGVTKLVVALAAGEGGISLVLDLQEDRFFEKARMSGGDEPRWIPGDREAMKEAEIEFSAFPALRVAGWSAVLAAVLVVLLMTIPSARGAFVAPGPLHSLHAELAQDCAACHAGGGDVTDASCLECHATTLAGRHPFPADPPERRGAAAVAVNERTCTRCHIEHLGTVAEEEPGGFVPTLAEWTDRMGCERCHLEGAPTLEDGRARAAGYAGVHAQAGPRGIAPGDAFSHALHAGEHEISCVQCHAPLERQVDGRDHAPVSFDTCRECHTTGPGRDADVVFPEAHGAEACQWCHADPEGGELRQVQTLARRFVGLDGEPISLADDRPRLLFSFASHGHVDEVRARRDDCADCHHRRIDSMPRVDRRFWHALHLPPRVLDGSLPPDAVRATCAQCHAAVVDSDTLAGIELPYDGGDASGCARCHASERNRREAPSLSPGMTTSETTRPDFPHERHANLGCLECHPMGSPEDYRAVPAAPFEVRTCVACHDDHASLPSCEQCHSPAESIFSSDAPPARDYGSFSHLEPGHRTDDCMRCHTNAADATRISEVELPSGDGAACFECHFGERYHWR